MRRGHCAALRGTLQPTKRGWRYAPNAQFFPEIANANVRIPKRARKLDSPKHYQGKLRNRCRMITELVSGASRCYTLYLVP